MRYRPDIISGSGGKDLTAHKNFLKFFIPAFCLTLFLLSMPSGRAYSQPYYHYPYSETGGICHKAAKRNKAEICADGTDSAQTAFEKALSDCSEAASPAAAAALTEARTGKILFEKNSDERLPMASTTKTMTALIVIENCSIDETVEIPPEAAGVEGSSMYLKKGERLSVKDLLYGLMLLSGNDAAVALAIHTAGSVPAFAALMNARAESLGLTDTHFVTPNGLHDKAHYTTAKELCMIGAEAMKNDTFRKIVSTEYYVSETGEKPRTMKNKNSLLRNYPGACGIKTGYTSAAGRCLLFCAEKDGMLLIGAVLHCRPMFEVSQDMLDFGFENFALHTVFAAGDKIAGCFVQNGVKSILALTAKEDIIIPIRKGVKLSAETHVSLGKNTAAPVFKGEELASAELFVDGESVLTFPLTAGESIPSRDFLFYLKLLLRFFGRK